MNRRRTRGVALPTALLAVALAVVLLAILLDAVDAGQARTATVARQLQAEAYARGLERWALELLRRDAAFDEGRDSLAEAWATGLPPTPVEGGLVFGRLVDQGGCFNVNNLVAGGLEVGYQRARFDRLLMALKLDPAIADAVVDWIDPDLVPGPRGAEDAVYAQRNPPYRVANRPLAHASELRAVAGLDEEAWRRLAPHVCALPPPTPLNVNTATIPVLMALDPGIDEAFARRLARDGRADRRSIEDFRRELEGAGILLPDLTAVGVATTHFVAVAEIELDGIPFTRSALIERGRGPQPDRVLARASGAW
jgi:general secretion pathway protein K